MAYNLLIVDDNPADVRLLADAMAECRIPVTIHAVANGVLAFRFLAKQGEYHDAPSPDLVILDLHMPIIDGTEVLHEIRGSRTHGKVPTVVLTSSNRDGDRAACLALGATDYFVKPAVWKDHCALAERLVRYIRGATGTN